MVVFLHDYRFFSVRAFIAGKDSLFYVRDWRLEPADVLCAALCGQILDGIGGECCTDVILMPRSTSGGFLNVRKPRRDHDEPFSDSA